MKIKHEALRFLLAGTALVLTYLLTNQTTITTIKAQAVKKPAKHWVVASNSQGYKSH